MLVARRYPHAWIVNSTLLWMPVWMGPFSPHFGRQQLPSPLSSSHSLLNGYGNNSINGIKALPTWFLLATFTVLSIIPPHQLLFGLNLCIFIKFINDDINCSHKCSCKSLRMTWLISNEKLMNLGGLGLLLLLPSPKLLIVATQIVFFHQIHQRRHQLQS